MPTGTLGLEQTEKNGKISRARTKLYFLHRFSHSYEAVFCGVALVQTQLTAPYMIQLYVYLSRTVHYFVNIDTTKMICAMSTYDSRNGEESRGNS